MRSTHSDQVERWLGKETCDQLSNSMRGWYGGPIAVHNVPGNVWIGKDGDFVGRIDGGKENSLIQVAWDKERARRFTANAFSRRQGGGFGTIAALQSSRRQPLAFAKNGTVTTAGSGETGWFVGSLPAAGSAAAAAPGGTVPTTATTGAMTFNNADTGKTLHCVGGMLNPAFSNTSVLIYDRIFSVTKTMNSTATEAVTGVPTRYQSTTTSAEDSAENNFLFIEARTTLAATAHNWTTCTYADQGNNAGATLPSVTGVSAAAVNRLDMPAGSWFCPLAAGDSGIKALTQMQCSALVATGAIDFTIGHPIAFLPSYSAQYSSWQYGINSAFNFVRILDNACLSVLGLFASSSAQTWRGYLEVCEA
jgi:hypothetical protein